MCRNNEIVCDIEWLICISSIWRCSRHPAGLLKLLKNVSGMRSKSINLSVFKAPCNIRIIRITKVDIF